MKNNKKFLIAIFVSLLLPRLVLAGSFESDVRGVGGSLRAFKAERPAAAGINAAPAIPGEKWWSLDAFGSAHKAIAQAALAYINARGYRDMAAARMDVGPGSNDESAHPGGILNGGRTDELWFGEKPETGGGVLRNYANFKFHEAYAKLGTICHLTQDMATPTHAANVQHGINDSFEGSGKDTVRIESIRFYKDLEPYAYYQALQDDTRRRLPGWKDPKTGEPYWVPAPDAPPLGQDATYGPWGHYGGKNNLDIYAVRTQAENGGALVSASPEIRFQRLAAAAEATVRVLESASRRLPPLVRGLAVTPREGGGAVLNFTALDNRSGSVNYIVSLYRDGVSLGVVDNGSAALTAPDESGIMRKADVYAGWRGDLDGRPLPAGDYVLDVRLVDTDGNRTPDLVNSGDNAAGRTTAPITIK